MVLKMKFTSDLLVVVNCVVDCHCGVLFCLHELSLCFLLRFTSIHPFPMTTTGIVIGWWLAIESKISLVIEGHFVVVRSDRHQNSSLLTLSSPHGVVMRLFQWKVCGMTMWDSCGRKWRDPLHDKFPLCNVAHGILHLGQV